MCLSLPDTILYINWYDHEGIIAASGLDIAKFPYHYFALLFILQRFDRADWGRCGHSSLVTTPIANQSVCKITVGGKVFVLDTKKPPRCKPLAIGGRANGVWECQEEGGSGAPCVVKLGWKDSSRQSEGEILQKAAALPLKNPRSIPEVVAAETFSDISTSAVRTRLGIATYSRELTALVMTKLDGLINELRGWELWDVLWDAIDSESLFVRASGAVPTHKVQPTTSFGDAGLSIEISATATSCSGGIR